MRAALVAVLSFVPAPLLDAAQCPLLAADAPDPTGGPRRLAGDRFGASLALAGEVLLVGAPRAGAVALQRGAVHVFERQFGGWRAGEVLLGGEPLDRFGNAIALSEDGRQALVAAFFERQSGVLHAFARTVGGWSEVQEIVPSDAQLLEGFGYALALDGEALLAGAPFRDGPGSAFASGAVFAFEHDGDDWVEVQQIVAGDGRPGAWFGAALAQRGTWAAVGAPLHAQRGSEAGAVELLERTPAGWVLRQRLLPSGAADGAHFGAALALQGEWLAVGAPERLDGAVRRGSVHLFRRVGSAWIAAGALPVHGAAAGARIGASLTFDGDARLLVGAPGVPGRVHVFERTGDDWRRVRVLAERPDGREWGAAVAAARGRWAVGIPGDDGSCPFVHGCDSGSVRLLAAPIEAVVRCHGTLVGGAPARLALQGCGALEAQGLVARASGLPPHAQVIVLVGGPPLGAAATLCVGAPAVRWACGGADAAGVAQLELALHSAPPALAAFGGTWRLQAWFKPGVGPAGLTDGLEVTFGW
jgi:hypothetical protein